MRNGIECHLAAFAAVVSPPSLATSACAASWHVVEKRKTMYQIAPRARSGVFMVAANAKGMAPGPGLEPG